VAELLELPHLVEQHGVAEMQIGGRRSKPALMCSGLPRRSLRTSSAVTKDFLGASQQLCEFGVEISHGARDLLMCVAAAAPIDRTFAARVGFQPLRLASVDDDPQLQTSSAEIARPHRRRTGRHVGHRGKAAVLDGRDRVEVAACQSRR